MVTEVEVTVVVMVVAAGEAEAGARGAAGELPAGLTIRSVQTSSYNQTFQLHARSVRCPSTIRRSDNFSVRRFPISNRARKKDCPDLER